MKMDEHARAWIHEFVAGILTSTALAPEQRNSLHWEILSHLHEAAERKAKARGGDLVTLADLQAVVAEMRGREGITSTFLETRIAAMPRAGFGKRFGAFLVDVVVAFMVFGFLGFASAIFPVPIFFGLEPFFFPFGLGLVYLYLVFTEFRLGATIGKMAFKLRTVKTDGRPITIEAALIRNVAKVFPPLLVIDTLLYLLAFKQDDQRGSDRIAETIVIDTTRTALAWPPTPPAPAAPDVLRPEAPPGGGFP